MKFCKDCKWASFTPQSVTAPEWNCTHPELAPKPYLDMVTGESYAVVMEYGKYSCSVMRHRETACGERAHYFEAKEK